MTLLELALWKAKLDDEKEEAALEFQPKKAKMDVDDSARKEIRITSGASHQECASIRQTCMNLRLINDTVLDEDILCKIIQ
jgi:hypothetical protein